MTMTCARSRRQMELFLDGELDVEDNMAVLQHLNLCASCPPVYEGEKDLRSLVKEGLSAPVPEGLMERVRARVRRESRPPWRAPALAAAALIALVAGFLIVPQGRAEELGAVVRAAARHHETAAGGVCLHCESRDSAMACCEQKAGYCPCVHDEDMGCCGFEWRYASTADGIIRGRLVCWMTFEDGRTGTRVSQASVPAEAVRALEGGVREGPLRLFRVGEKVVMVLDCGKLICIFVVENPADEERVKRTLIARH